MSDCTCGTRTIDAETDELIHGVECEIKPREQLRSLQDRFTTVMAYNIRLRQAVVDYFTPDHLGADEEYELRKAVLAALDDKPVATKPVCGVAHPERDGVTCELWPGHEGDQHAWRDPRYGHGATVEWVV